MTSVGGAGLFALAVIEDDPSLRPWWISAYLCLAVGVLLLVVWHRFRASDLDGLGTLSRNLDGLSIELRGTAKSPASTINRALIREYQQTGKHMSWGRKNRKLRKRFICGADTSPITNGEGLSEVLRMQALVKEAHESGLT